jgi:uncharacterized protein
MFGSYEIARDGSTYHGNVALKEHRLVERDGEHCLFLVPDMVALPVSGPLAEAVAGLTPGFATLVPDGLMQALRGCGLVAEAERDAGPGGDAAGVGAGAEAPATPPDLPVVSLALFLTQTCNLRCVYCYGEGGEYGERGVMSEETALAAVDWLLTNSFEEKSVQVSFFGGEPLLNFPLLQHVVAYAKEEAAARGKEVGFGVTTNASLLTDEMIAFLAEERIDTLVSFDGPPDIHDRQRPFRDGRGSYRCVRANVERLRAALPRLTGRATVCAGNDPFAVRRGMEEAGFTSCALTAASPVVRREAGKAGATSADQDVAAGRREAAEQMLAYRRAEVAELFVAVRERRLGAGASATPVTMLAGLAEGRKRHSGCGLGRGMRAVAVGGDVYPCHRFVGLDDLRLGHLSDYRADGINDYHRSVVENLPACRSCWARYFCGGGCFYDNLARTGDMRRPDPGVCRETRTLCEDVIIGWCALSDEDKAYAQEQIEKLEEDLRT